MKLHISELQPFWRKSRRYGRFRIPTPWVLSGLTAVKRVMGKCTVLRAESRLETDEVEYIAHSEHFREIAHGEIIPSYRWIVLEDGLIECEEVACLP